MMRMWTRTNSTRRITVGLAMVAAGLLIAVALAPTASLAQGCAMCATYLSNGQDPRADAFKISIIFLMCMPFIVVASAGGWILWMHWRIRPRRPSLRLLGAEGEGVS
jgi:hypothetical protein